MDGFLRFLRENWLWIVFPIVSVFVVLALFLYFTASDDPAPFDYPIF